MTGGPPPVPGGRTPEEREAARRAREARRDGNSDGARPPRDWMADARRLTANRPNPRIRGRRIVALLLVGGVILLAGWFLVSLFQPFKGDGGGRVQVVIPKGSGVGDIADLLEKRGVVSSSFFFSLRAHLSGKGGDLKPGTYALKKDMSNSAAIDALTKGPPPNIVTLTIPEGRSRREVGAIVGNSLAGSYLSASRRSSGLDPRKYGARHATSLEGFLFPATYTLKRGRPVSLLVDQQLTAFRQKFGGVGLRYARSKNLTAYDVLTIASMVEREAAVAKERPVIASVIYNRLHAHIPLGIDATIRFATNNWTKPLTNSQLRIASPYNTRTHAGLPPGPIGSPGLASIEAAAHPAHTKYLYYVVKVCGGGEHVFSRTYAQFQRDSARYESERKKRGRSPENC
ncbi:MAG: endolytic transglycosylase MltG [Thermoleophilaceae bacterium]